MTIKVQTVATEFVAQVWPQVEGFIKRAHKHGGDDYSMDQIKMFLTMGNWLLLVATGEDGRIHGAMTVSFINYPNDRVAFVTSTGGTGICSADSLQQMKQIVKSMGATKVQAGGRPSMVRMLRKLGFNERYTVVETRI
jgi:hypothetical protein